jgi:hypothetical protein
MIWRPELHATKILYLLLTIDPVLLSLPVPNVITCETLPAK